MSTFGFETTAMEVVEGVDLSGKRAIVTGGASGIGIETARALAAAGAAVTIAVRDLAAGERVAADVGGDVRVARLGKALGDVGAPQRPAPPRPPVGCKPVAGVDAEMAVRPVDLEVGADGTYGSDPGLAGESRRVEEAFARPGVTALSAAAVVAKPERMDRAPRPVGPCDREQRALGRHLLDRAGGDRGRHPCPSPRVLKGLDSMSAGADTVNRLPLARVDRS